MLARIHLRMRACLSAGFLACVAHLQCLTSLGMSGLLGLTDAHVESIAGRHTRLEMIGERVHASDGALLLCLRTSHARTD